jgi:hypothetical protein
MDGMHCEREIEKLKSMAKGAELTIIAVGSYAGRVLDVFAAQTTLKSVKTLVIDTEQGVMNLNNIQKKMLCSETFELNEEAVKSNAAPCDILIILTALGGTTSSILTPVIAEIGRRMGCTVITVPILPFSFEKERRQKAEKLLAELKEKSYIVATIDNDTLSKKMLMKNTAEFTAQRVQTLINNILPGIPKTLFERLIEEIKKETEQIILVNGKQDTQKAHVPVVLTAGATTELVKSIEIEEIVRERTGDTNNVMENKVISAEQPRNASEKIEKQVETTITANEISQQLQEIPKKEDNEGVIKPPERKKPDEPEIKPAGNLE